MRDDEYNKIPISDSSSGFCPEFGRIQKTEFSSREEDPKPHPEGNPTQGESQGNRIQPDADTILKGTQTTTSSASTAAKTVSSTAGAVVSTIAATTVVVIATVTGIEVLPNSAASCRFFSFDVYEEGMSYGLMLRDAGKNEFCLRVSNSNYFMEHELHDGENFGEFDGLTLGERYEVYVGEKRSGGKRIYDGSFTTVPVSNVYGLKWDKTANFLKGYFEVAVSFSDAQNLYSDFALSLTDHKNPEAYSQTFPLEKTLEPQLIQTPGLDYEDRVFDYVLSYMMEGEKQIAEQGEVMFMDNSLAISRFYGLKWDKTADYREGTFEVSLVYVDDFDRFASFALTLTDSEDPSRSYRFPLQKTLAVQTLSFENTGLDVSSSFSYSLTYQNKGVDTVGESGQVSFLNTALAQSAFLGLEFDKTANFLEKYFDLTLRYVDEESLLGDFVFTLENTDGERFEFPLEKTLEKQRVTAPNLEFEGVAYAYSLTYSFDGVTHVGKEGNVTFTDNSLAVSSFYGLKWDKTADFVEGTFHVALNYVDDFGRFSDFTLAFSQEEQSHAFQLNKTIDPQVLSFADTGLDVTSPMTYRLTYLDRGEIVVFEEGEITFTDSSAATSHVYGLRWDKTADFHEKTFEVALNFVDDYDWFSEFTLTLSQQGETSVSHAFSLQKTIETQTLSFVDTGLDLAQPMTYRFSYLDRGEEVVHEEGEISFTDSSLLSSHMYGLKWDKTIDYVTKEFEVAVNYVDGFDRFSDFTLTFTQQAEEEPLVRSFALSKTTEVQTLSLADAGMDVSSPLTYRFSYLDNGEEVVFEEEEMTFADSSTAVTRFLGLDWDYSADFELGTSTLTLSYEDERELYSDFTLALTDTGTNVVTEFSLTKTTEPQAINLTEGLGEFIRHSYTYVLSCLKGGELMTLEQGGPFTFTDPNRHSSVEAIVWDKIADFAAGTFSLALSFEEWGETLSDFRFTLTDNDPTASAPVSQTWELDKTQDVQTLAVERNEDEVPILDLRYGTFLYELTYSLDGQTMVAEEGEVSFSSSVSSTFGAVSYGTLLDSEEDDYRIPMRFDYEDPMDVFLGMNIVISTSGEEYEFSVDLTDEPFYLDLNEEEAGQAIVSGEVDIDFRLVQCDVKNPDLITQESVQVDEGVSFVREDRIEVFGMAISMDMDEGRYMIVAGDLMFYCQPLYVDGAGNMLEMTLVMETSDGTRYLYSLYDETKFRNGPVGVSLASPLGGEDVDEIMAKMTEGLVSFFLDYIDMSQLTGSDREVTEVLLRQDILLTVQA